jgi:formate--tetrahydrofolate ligase
LYVYIIMAHKTKFAQSLKMTAINSIANDLGVDHKYLTKYGDFIAKIDLNIFESFKKKKDGKLILVTAMTPTKYGDGKTTTSVGLAEAFGRLGKDAIVCLREPSLGPVFGLKGGGTGGGCAQVLPSDVVNLHFTGDIHAVGSANNLLAAMIDNHIYHGNYLKIDTKRIVWKRVIDMNDRALRNVMINGDKNGFEITAASEIMAIVALAQDYNDLKKRLGKIIVAFDLKGRYVTAKMLKADNAMAVLLRDAFMPNLVQTSENTPALIHTGCFANIAHGCSSVVATKLALKLADIVITEAGFGTDLGAEKFFNIKCRLASLKPDAAVIVATSRAVKENGIENLGKHIDNVREFNVPVVVVINKFKHDSNSQIKKIIDYCSALDVDALISESWYKCGLGGVNVDRVLLDVISLKRKGFRYLYSLKESIKAKIEKVAREIYGAKGVKYSKNALSSINIIERDFGGLPVCMAKTQMSLSDNPNLKGAPKHFILKILDVKVCAGAGFIVVYCGSIMTMPGLPIKPAAEHIRLNNSNDIIGMR